MKAKAVEGSHRRRRLKQLAGQECVSPELGCVGGRSHSTAPLNPLKLNVALPTKQGVTVARKTVYVSDLTGNTIDERNGAKLTIAYNDARRGTVVLDVNADEVDELARKGRKQARRGRKPKSAEDAT
jgi:hypothetical protein